MENATKALQMAAGVLVSIMILGLVVYGYNSLSATRKVEQDVIRQEQAVNFNKSFEGYNKDTLRGSELISLANKVEDYNARYLSTDGYTKIELTVDGIDQAKYPNYSQARFVNKLAERHTYLQSDTEARGAQICPGTTYTYKELYIMYNKGSYLLMDILGKSSQQEVVATVKSWLYYQRVQAMTDFSRHSFSKSDWQYDSYGRIHKIKFVY